MDGRKVQRVSQSKSDSETSPNKRPCLQRSNESSFEYMDVDVAPSCSKSVNDCNLNSRIIQRRSLDAINNLTALSGESGIDLTGSFDNINRSDDQAVVTDSEQSDIENVAHSTPQKKKSNRSIPLKTQLSIFKIDLDKVDTAIDKKYPDKVGVNKSINDRINFMIEVANPKPKRIRGKLTSSSKLNPLIGYALLSYKGYYDSTNIFELELYGKSTFRTDEETGVKMKNLHKVRFMYRSDPDIEEIFALPSGSGRSVVMQWADTNFPMSIASATLDGESVTEKEVKNLHQNRYLTKFKMKTGESLTTTPEFHLRFVPQVYTKFHADINDDNHDLRKILGQKKRSTVKMQVKLDSILFPGVVIDINGYAELCTKLSEIHNDSDLPRSRKFDGYLSKVPKDRSTGLDKLLRHQLKQFFRLAPGTESNIALGKLKNFAIAQKDSTKYYEASNYLIHHRGKLLASFIKRPQLQDIHTMINKKLKFNSFHSFVKQFDALSISTPTPSGGGCVKEKLFNCLEGVLYDENDEKNYWRVGSDWYVVSGKYTFEVYAEYIRVIKNSLLCKKECSLKALWPLKTDRKIPIEEGANKKTYNFGLDNYRQNRFIDEGSYNKLYSGEPNFVVTDAKVAPYGVEICDLFQFVPNAVDKSKIHLHHVKNVYGADGYRIAILQILCSANYLYSSILKGDRNNDSSAFKLFKFIEKDQKELKETILKSVYVNYKEFLDQLRNATFVFSPLFESGDRELDKDYMTLLKYDFSDIKDEIDEEYRDSLENSLKSFLLDSEYIYASDCVFTQKWFDACAVVNDRGFHVRNDRGFHFDPFPSKKISNMEPKKLRRLLKDRYYRTVEGLAVKQIIVHCSEVLNAMGFGFKICQIKGQADDLL